MKTIILKVLGSQWFWVVLIFLAGGVSGVFGIRAYDRWTAPEQDTAYVQLSKQYIERGDSLQIANSKLQIAEKIVKDLLEKNTEKGIEIIYKYAYRDTMILRQAVGKDYLDLKERFRMYSLGNPALNNYGFDSAEIKAMNLFCNGADRNKERVKQLIERDSINKLNLGIANGKLDNVQMQLDNCTGELGRVTNEPRITIKEAEYPVKMRAAVYLGYKNQISNFKDWKKGGGMAEIEAGIDLKRVPLRIGIEKNYNTDYEYKIKAGYIFK